MGILNPEFRYAMKRHRGLRKRTSERLVGKHLRRKEKFARTIRKHVSETLGAFAVVAALATGTTADTNEDADKDQIAEIDTLDSQVNEDFEQTTLAHNS